MNLPDAIQQLPPKERAQFLAHIAQSLITYAQTQRRNQNTSPPPATPPPEPQQNEHNVTSIRQELENLYK